MKRFVLIALWAAVCAPCLPVGQATAAAAEPWPAIVSGDSPAAQKIRAALDDDTKLEFIETPLNQVRDFLQDQHGIPIQLDQRALDDIGMPANAPITADLKGISLRSALRLMLRDLDLDFAVVDEVLLITTPEVSATRAEIRVYNVAELLGGDEDASALAATVATVLSPAALQMPGFPGGMGGGGMGGMGGGGMGGGYFSVPETQIGGGVHGAAEAEGAGGLGGGHGMAHGMSSACPGGGLGADATAAHGGPPVQITPMKNLLIVRGTDEGQRAVGDLLGALAVAMGGVEAAPPRSDANPADPFR